MRPTTSYILAAAEMAMLTCLITCFVRAQDAGPDSNDGDATPILRLEAGGPTSFVSSLAFNPASGTLYAGSWDKVVRAWPWDQSAGRFVLDASATYRVPLGPDRSGFVNAIAVSPDGEWLAAAGEGTPRGASDFRHSGLIVPSAGMSREARMDLGTIYLFNTRTREVKTLRGHAGPVVAMEFAPSAKGKPLTLISVAREWNDTDQEFNKAVVRVWNATDASTLGELQVLKIESKFDLRPDIAAWHTGQAPQQLRVAIAHNDGILRLWDVDSKQAVRQASDGRYNGTVVWCPVLKQLITGSAGRLRQWNVSTMSPSLDIPLPYGQGFPQAIALFSSNGAALPDRAAVAVKFKNGSTEAAWLLALDLNNRRWLPGSELRLWDGTGFSMSLAAIPGGRRIAIAGNPNHEVATVAVDTLLTRRTGVDRLRGRGLTARKVSFVKKNGALGVALSERANPQRGAATTSRFVAGDLVFEPARRRVSNYNSDWEVSQPGLDGWHAEAVTGAKGPSIDIFDGNRVVRSITFSGTLSDYALLPPRLTVGVPILALATHRQAQPLLQIYNAATGEIVRQLAGHEFLVHALAFSEDGKLLASVAGDRTVCIWSMADLAGVVATRGALTDIALEQDGQTLIVRRVNPAGPNARKVKVGDVLVGWTGDSESEAFGSLVDLYRRTARSKPGETIELKRRRQAQAADTVSLKLGQAIDERKPLVNLFLMEDEHRNWLAWSPLGPYESSDEAVEQLLGWHFNTGQPSAPTRFALADEYRKLRRPGLVEHLLRKHVLPDEARVPLGAPTMNSWISQSVAGFEVQAAEGHGPLRLIEPQAELNLEIRGIAPEQLAGITWRVGDNEPKPLEQVSQELWTATLSGLASAGREIQRIRLELTTNENPPQTFGKEFSVAYRPLPPTVETVHPNEQSSVVKEAQYQLKFEVQSTEKPSGDVTIGVEHNGKEVLAKNTIGANDSKSIELGLKLSPGDNVIRIVAANASAIDGDEQNVVVRRITFNPMPVVPPQLFARVVAPGVERELTSDQGEPLVVHALGVAIVGSVKAEEKLTIARWNVDGQGGDFPGFTADSVKEFDLDQLVPLKPGRQVIRCQARAANSVPTEVSLAVIMQPQVGELSLNEPSTVDLIEGRDDRRIKLDGHLQRAAGEFPFETSLLVNGQRQAAEVAIVDDKVSTEVDLQNGDNRVEVQLSNQWGAQSASNTLHLRYLRPPRIIEMKDLPKQVDRPLIDLEFTVASPTDLELTALQVNDWNLLENKQKLPPGPDQEPGITFWKVAAHDVPLQIGRNEIRPLAANRDGWSIETKSSVVTVMVAPARLAEIDFTSPGTDSTKTGTAEIDVSFVVRSESPLKRAELRHNSHPAISFDVSRQIADAKAGEKPKTWRLESQSRIRLDDDVNHLRVVAVNDGGESVSDREVTYVRRPAHVVIERLEPQNDTGKGVIHARQEGNVVTFAEPASDGNMWLHGKVDWIDAASARSAGMFVQVIANGFLQPPVPLAPDPKQPSLEWRWKTKVRLNRQKGNKVGVSLTDVPNTADSQMTFSVDCSHPDERQQLHYLVVGVDEEDSRLLERLALQVVQGQRKDDRSDEICAPAFSKGKLYSKTGYVNVNHVTARLNEIRRAIVRHTKSPDAGLDVVVVYFRGQEESGPDGSLYLRTSARNPLLKEINETKLLQHFSRIPGAQLFLLDVQRSRIAPDNVELTSQRPSEEQAAMLRYVWINDGEQVAVNAPPPDARLLDTVSKAVPRPVELGDVEIQLAKNSKRARQAYPENFRDEMIVPDALRGLVLSKRN